jgi:hypothetical protein
MHIYHLAQMKHQQYISRDEGARRDLTAALQGLSVYEKRLNGNAT